MHLFVTVLIFLLYPKNFPSTMDSMMTAVSCGKIDPKLVASFDDDFSAIMDELKLLHNKSTTTASPTPVAAAAPPKVETEEGISKPTIVIPQHNNNSNNVTTLNSNSNFKPSSSLSSSSTSSSTAAAGAGRKQQRTCACDDSEESLVCASNGVTYKNVCRFECAKARVERLRQVKEGRCSQAAGAQSYWQSNKSG